MSDRPTLDAAPPIASYAPPYQPPRVVPMPPAPDVRRSSVTGITALVLALVAAVLAPIAAGIAVYAIGTAGIDFVRLVSGPSIDWAVLSPVRDLVLLGEVAAWVGAAAGLWAFVQGIVATVRGAGRGQGIAAIVIAVLAPVLFTLAVIAAVSMGLAASFG